LKFHRPAGSPRHPAGRVARSGSPHCLPGAALL